jgi:hypothetical protein
MQLLRDGRRLHGESLSRYPPCRYLLSSMPTHPAALLLRESVPYHPDYASAAGPRSLRSLSLARYTETWCKNVGRLLLIYADADGRPKVH